jgi:ribosomal protein L20A (L18A)
MAETKSIDLVINTAEAATSLSEVKKAMKDIKSAMLQVGEDSPQFNKLAAAAADLKDRVEETNKAIARTDPDKFNGLASAAKVAATGIQLTTGAMALFGSESEEVNKTMMKVQAAMAFAEGLQGIQEAEKELNSLWKKALENPMQAVLISVVAIGAAAYALYENYQEANSEATKLKEVAEETKKTNDKALVVEDNKLRLMQAQGANAFDIHEQEKKILALKIQTAEADFLAAKAMRDRVATTDTLWEKTVNLMKLTQPNYVTEAVDKKMAQDKIARVEEETKKVEDAYAVLQSLKTDEAVSDAKYNDILVKQAQDASAKKVAIKKQEIEDIDGLEKAHAKNTADIVDESMQHTMVVQQYVMDGQISMAEERLNRLHKFAKDLSDKNNKYALDSVASLFGSLAELSKKNAKAQKGFAVAQATINTYKGVTSALAQPTPLPVNLIMAAAALAAGLVQVRNIMAVKEDGGGGAGGIGGSISSGGMGAINTAPEGIQPTTQLDANGNVIGQNGQPMQPQRVYVVESDITHTQAQVAVTQSAMSFH